MKDNKIDIFKKASYIRNFELEVFKNVKNKNINIPVYLSAGQEFISSTLSHIINKELNIKPLIFAQHRCHATYLNFGGDPKSLVDELLERKTGCNSGLGGSASLSSKKIKMFGHDGHMGTQMPIGLGACFASKKPTIIFLGDASLEEDYVMSSIGWASFKKLPILIIVEDNNLSILTKKKIRRHWEASDLAKGLKMKGVNINDDPKEIEKSKKNFFKEPLLMNINTTRLFWHAGAGEDDYKRFDRYKDTKKKLGKIGEKIDKENSIKVLKLWQKQLKK
jgi:TPP-dependent pyruvate/acetoin dehydrogenase alpha subunit